MNWIINPVTPKRQWPKPAITREEHDAIIERESNLERKAFDQLCWNIGDFTQVAMAENLSLRCFMERNGVVGAGMFYCNC